MDKQKTNKGIMDRVKSAGKCAEDVALIGIITVATTLLAGVGKKLFKDTLKDFKDIFE